MIEMPHGRCQLRDQQTKQLVCENERKYQCYHCKTFVCAEHSRQGRVNGTTVRYCVICDDAIFSRKSAM